LYNLLWLLLLLVITTISCITITITTPLNLLLVHLLLLLLHYDDSVVIVAGTHSMWVVSDWMCCQVANAHLRRVFVCFVRRGQWTGEASACGHTDAYDWSCNNAIHELNAYRLIVNSWLFSPWLGQPSCQKISHTVWWKLHDHNFNRFRLIHPSDGRTDGQRDGRAIAYTRYSIYAVARNYKPNKIYF